MKSIIMLTLNVVIFLGLVIVAFVYQPLGLIAFEIPKVKFLYLWSILILFLVILEIVRSKKILGINILQILVLVWLGTMTIASLFGVDWEKSVFGNYYRWDGLITHLSLVGTFLGLSLLGDKTWWNWVEHGLIVGNFGSILWVIGQGLMGASTGFGGYGAGFGQPIFLTGYLLVTSPITWSGMEKIKNGKWRAVLFWFHLLLSIWALLLTKTLVALFCFPVYLLLFLVINKKVNWWTFLITTLIFGLLVLGIYGKEMEKGRFEGGLAYEGRVRLGMKSLLAFKEKPVLGWGVANYDRAFAAISWPMKIEKDVYVDKAHSNLIEMFVTGGVLGGVAYLGVLVCAVWLLINKQDRQSKLVLLFLVAYLIHSQTNVTSVAEEMFFWLILARIES